MNIKIIIKTNRSTLISTGTIVLLAIIFTELFAHSNDEPSEFFALVLILLLFGIPIVLALTVIDAIKKAVQQKSRALQLESVLLSYICLIVSFAFFYYFLISINDYSESVTEYHYYKKLDNQNQAGEEYIKEKNITLYRIDSDRAFKGISVRMWNGIHEKVSDWPSDAGEPPISKLIAVTHIPIDEILSFNDSSRLPIIIDCLYFSTSTITTLGFGDITPINVYGKIAASIEVLSGMIMVVVGIGFALRS